MLEHLQITRPMAVLDLETTGTQPTCDRIVELAVFRLEPSGHSRWFYLRINPGMPIPSSATAVHGITDADVAQQPRFEHCAEDLAVFLHGCDLVGYNICRFDLPLLMAEFARVGLGFDLSGRAVVDALKIFQQRESRSLAAALRFYCGRSLAHAHHAAHDVMATLAVLESQLAMYADLPRSLPELHRKSTSVDIAGHFTVSGGDIVFGMGKHRGRSLREIAQYHPDYLDWMLRQSFLPDVKSLVWQALQQV